jgi:hypothetical protein
VDSTAGSCFKRFNANSWFNLAETSGIHSLVLISGVCSVSLTTHNTTASKDHTSAQWYCPYGSTPG